MKKMAFLIIICFVFMMFSLAVAADIPMMLNYQGYVEYGEEGSRSPFNGDGYFKFAIVNTNGNTTYWSNDGTSTTGDEPVNAVMIPVTNGVFTVKLGNTDMTNMSALPTATFDQQNIYVRVWFSDDEETSFDLLSPDTQILSAGFAYKAQTVVDSSVTSSIIQDGTITNSDISSNANIDISKIDTSGLDADTLDGNDSSAFATAGHTHTDIDADTLDGKDSSAFAIVGHIHNDYAQIIHSHTGSEITSGTILNERLDPDLQDLAADGLLSATRVQHGTYFIDSVGTSGQVWKSDGSGKGYWGTDNTGGGGGLWSQSGSNIYYNSGNVGIGTTSPGAKLEVNGASSIFGSGNPRHLMLIKANDVMANEGARLELEGGDGYRKESFENWAGALRIYRDSTLTAQFGQTGGLYIGSSPGGDSGRNNFPGAGNLIVEGNVGIGTTDPKGKLDVNGSIYQRGTQLHADYVFESDYKLESIKEHAEFMWNNKHLEAIPKAQIDENGKEIVEVGTYQKGIVEELEKAHIYIEQLHTRLETLEAELVQLKELKDKLSKL